MAVRAPQAAWVIKVSIQRQYFVSLGFQFCFATVAVHTVNNVSAKISKDGSDRIF